MEVTIIGGKTLAEVATFVLKIPNWIEILGTPIL